jgi:hypothetical protein
MQTNQFITFCQNKIYFCFVFFGIGLSLPLLSKFLPGSLQIWILLLSLVITIPAAIFLAIGLLVSERQKRENKNKSDSK